jgi:hypothetical protein
VENVQQAADITSLVVGGLCLLFYVVLGVAAIFQDDAKKPRARRKEDE